MKKRLSVKSGIAVRREGEESVKSNQPSLYADSLPQSLCHFVFHLNRIHLFARIFNTKSDSLI